MYYIYILKSQKDGKLYIGQTNNVERRLYEHNRGKIRSTKYRTPLVLLYKENLQTRAKAMKREKYLKSLKGGNEFKKIIAGE